MGKSLEEVMKKMQLEHEQRIQARNTEEQKTAMIAEQQRRQWTERNRMYEKSTTTSAASSAAAGAAGAGAGGSLNKLTNFLLFDFNTFTINRLRTDGTVIPENVQPFTGATSLASCSDDPGFLYFVTQDNEIDSTFGKLNKRTLVRTDIDTLNLRALSVDQPSSLVYTGEGIFYYMDSFVANEDDGSSSTYTISTTGEAIAIGNIDNTSNFPLAVFNYNNQWYITATEGFFTTSLRSIDFNESTTEFIDYLYIDSDSLPTGIGPSTKVWYVFDVVNQNGTLYVSVVFTDKDNGSVPLACIGELILDDLENPYINYLYAIPGPFIGDESPIFTSIDLL